MTTPYQPIACALHDEYEIAIMHKKCLKIKWSADNADYRMDKVLPKDILIINREEFLVAVDQESKELCIRLDKIILLE